VNAFDLLDEWPVGRVAAGVMLPDRSTHLYGDANDVFALASITKPLTALATLIAVEEGIVGLDDRCGPPAATIRHLLAHAAGLAPDQRRLLTEPARRRIYSNSGYEIVADAVAAGSEIEFESYFTEALVEPLGLMNTKLTGSPAYGADSSVADLLVIVGELTTDNPRLLAQSTIDEMCAPAFPDLAGVLPGYGIQDPNTWGLGFEIRGLKRPHWTGSSNSRETFGHFGRAGTFLWIDPVAQVACVVLTDREFGDWAKQRWPAFSEAVLTSL